MKINYCCLCYYSSVVLILSSVTKTSEDKRMVTDHCCLSSSKVLNMDEIVEYDSLLPNGDFVECDRSILR